MPSNEREIKTLSCLTEIVGWQRSWHVSANKGNGLRARRPGVAITAFLLSYRGNSIVVTSSWARQTDILVPAWCEVAAASGYTALTRWRKHRVDCEAKGSWGTIYEEYCLKNLPHNAYTDFFL